MVSVRDMHASGQLAQEVEDLGLKGEWLEALRNEPARVVISEQLQPVPNLFSALDQYGHPKELRRSVLATFEIQRALGLVLGEQVEAGYLASRHHGVSFAGVSFGGYFTVPNNSAEGLTRIPLFSKRERELYHNAAYGDLMVSRSKIEEIATAFRKVLETERVQERTALKALSRQVAHNQSVLLATGCVGSELEERLLQAQGLCEKRQLRVAATQAFLEDLYGAAEEGGMQLGSSGSQGDAISYMNFIASFNGRFVDRVQPGQPFPTFFNDTVDALPSLGVRSWPRFITKLLESGVFSDGDALCRLRMTDERGVVRYANVWLEEVSPTSVRVFVRGGGSSSQAYRLEDLAESSAQSVARGEGPILTPVGRLRYLANLAWSPSVIQYDGMEFEPISRVLRAMASPGLLAVPRKPKLYPYSGAHSHMPSDLNNPWQGLREKHHVLDYYEEALAVASRTH
jgi:hypothetical protein